MTLLKQSTLLILLATLFAAALPGQRAVPAEDRYERLVCVVPMIGAGTADDPRRPQFASAGPGDASPFLAYTYLLSDDGQSALVEYVATDPSAFNEIMASTDPRIKKFRKGRVRRADVEKEFRKYRKSFNLDNFGAMVQ